MDGTVLGLYLIATFIGGLTSGLSGFAMGLVLSSLWLQIIPPAQTAALIVGYGLLTQGYAIWKLRGAFSWRTIAPFILGGGLGVPLGVMLLTYIDPAVLRPALGAVLVLYSIYSLTRPALRPVTRGIPADTGVGILNGMLGGLTGLTGIVVTVWSQVRGWSKDAQRAVFQPVNFATIVISAVAMSAAGAITGETLELYVLGLPAVLAGLWLGFKLYGRLDDAAFRKVLLLLLLLSGAALVVPIAV